ncbi:LysR family transcriptional regulator [Rhizobium tubonense]|nr:LysR family transcriptional regulator [Rhizobium tubonense]
MDRFQSMKILVKAADVGSFANAARQLHMSPPAVTRAIAYLEEVTGARLFIRSTRSVKLTAAGRLYVEDCRRILTAIDEAEASAGGSHASPSGVLTVTAPVLFGQIYIMPILIEFLREHPAVTGRVLLFDRVVSLVEEGIDVAIRIGQLQDSDYVATRIGSVRRVVCGAPAYFKEHGVPETPADLLHHTIVVNTGSSAPIDWRFGSDKSPVSLHPRLFCNTVEASIAAAASGWGLARVLSYQIAPAVAEGRLEVVLEPYEQEPLPIHVMHSEGRHVSAKTRAFVDFTVERLRDTGLGSGSIGIARP